MEDVAAAIDGVKKAAQKNRDKAVAAAIDDLSSTLRLLQLSSSSTKTHSTLCKLFVEKLGALYTAYPHLMCRYAAAVLTAIFQEKIKPAFDMDDLKLQSSWENVQKSVVSGVIDFLEEKSTTSASNNASNKSAAAECLYPVICAIFYPPKLRVEWRTSSLIFNVNLLLYETVTRHPANQTSLRSEKVLGPTRIGLALSQNRDFIVLDSLLLLIGALLPSRQKPAKRSSFVDDVFKPELFRQSDEIKNLIASSTDSQWDPVAVKIINSLAGSDLSFPQPFYISKLRASIELPKFAASDPVYLDERSLFVNVDQDNESMLGSFQVLFVNIKQIKIGGPGNPPTLVAITVNDASDGPGQQWTVQFQLNHADTGRFAQTFKERGLSRLISEPKISKLGEPLGLTFESTQQYPPSRQEKVDKLQHVWDSGRPTSPLVSDPSKTPDQKHDSPQAASSIHEAIDGDALTDMSENEEKPVSKPKRPTAKPKPPPSPAPPMPTVESDQEDDVPSKARTKKNRKNRVVESEDEDEDNTKDSQSSPPPSNLKDQDFEPTQPDAERVPVDVPARVTRGAVKKNPALANDAAALKSTGKEVSALTAVTGEDGTSRGRSIRRTAARKSAVDKELTLSDDDIEDEKIAQGPIIVDVKSQKTSTEKADSEAREVTKVKSGFKRVNADEHLGADADPRPTKRVRRPTSAVLEVSETMPPLRRDSAIVFGTVAPAPAKKRYGGKRGRTSSPVHDYTAGDVDMNIDYDELPGAYSPPPSPIPVKAPKAAKHESKAMNEPQTRVAAMKGKGGQKPAAKGPVKATKPAPRAKAKAKTEPEISTEVVEENEPEEVKPLRRSGRASNAAPQEEKPTVDTVPKPKATKKAEKPRKAPWEDMHLLKKEAAIATEDLFPLTDADAVAQDDVEVEVLPDAFEEYYVPLKGSTDPLAFPEDDAPMVDLTHDTPPRATDKQPEVDTSLLVPDVTRTRPLDSAPMQPTTTSTSFVLATPAVPAALAAAPATVPVKSTLAVRRSPKPLLPSETSLNHNNHPIYPSTVATKLAALPIIPDVTPIRLQLHSPVASVEAGPAPQPPVSKFESDLPSRSNKPAAFLPTTTSPPPQVSPRKPSPSANSLRLNKPAHLQPRQQRHFSESPVAPAHHQVIYDSPFPKRVDQATTLAPSRTSTPSGQRTAHALPIRKTVQYTAYEDTPDLGRPSRTFGRAPLQHEVDGRDHHTKRSRSPMQGILEILNEIQDVVVEKIHQRFDHVKKDVRIGRDTILRTATTNLETMCVESERHFNNLVDLEKDYAAYHRDIISGIDDVHKSAQVMSNALGKIVQQHDRGSLSKKLPPSLFFLPSTIRKPLVL